MANTVDLASRSRALADAIQLAARGAANEEELRLNVELALRPLVDALSITVAPRYEAGVQGDTARGRADAVYGGVYIEYKRPGRLASEGARHEAVRQVSGYLETVNGDRPRFRRRPRLVGVVTDGTTIIFVRPAALSDGAGWTTSSPLPVEANSVALLLQYLRALDRLPLTGKNLGQAFGPGSQLAQEFIKALYNRLSSADAPIVSTLFAEWDRIFGIVYGQDAARETANARVMGDLYKIAKPDLKRLFFCVHTYYALVMKVLAIEVASLQQGAFIASFAADVAGTSDSVFDAKLRALEDGSEFRRLEISNFLEGDFFGWYLAAWDDELRGLVRRLISTLDDFDATSVSSSPLDARDILKHLYQYLVPRHLRHALGEYYTPDWLAEFVITEAGYDGNPAKRVVDPACGSGTFLALEIGRALAYADDHLMEEREVAKSVVQNIVGFDLNPLAVLAARTTYLLALGPLLRHVRPLEIPVYLCDSVLLPRPEDGLFGSGQRLSTSVGTFIVPSAIDDEGKMARFAEALERAVRGRHDELGFIATVEHTVTTIDSSDKELLSELFRFLIQLETDRRNGIWARIIKNAFAPVFVSRDKFDFVIGNPPWVNWESLSDDYRRASRQLWVDQGLFSLRGQQARLGGGKKDLAMLMTYVAAERYLKDRGTLAFLITQTVFKTAGAGSGFRRFRLADSTPLKVRAVHDFSSIQPFDGASNRTAVVIVMRDEETTFPVPWTEWRKTERQAPSPFTSFAQAFANLQRTDLVASPISDRETNSAWLTTTSGEVTELRRAVGKSPYKGYTGAYTGGLDGAYLVRIVTRRADGNVLIRNYADAGKIAVQSVELVVEPELLYPLLLGRDVHRWVAVPSREVVLAQDPDTRSGIPEEVMRGRLPLTYEYLSRFKPQLLERAAFKKFYETKDAFYSMYNIGSYTLSPWKMVWRQQAATMTAAVCGPLDGRPVVPNHKLTLVPTESEDEAHYLCAVLNSPTVARIVRGYALSTGITTHVLDHVAVPRFDPGNRTHSALVDVAKAAKAAGSADEPLLEQLADSLWPS